MVEGNLRLLRHYAGLLSILLMLSAGMVESFAHARLARSNPANKSELAAAPATIDLWFNELLEDGFNTLELFHASDLKEKTHTNLLKQKPVVDSRDKTHISVRVGPLDPGDYVVEWRVLSKDGHSAPGRLAFRVLGPGR